MKIAIAAPHEVDRIWPLVRDGMGEACKHFEGWTPGELWQLVRSGNGFLIIVFDDHSQIHMASIWQFQEKNGRPVFRCVAMYGHKMKTWLFQAKEFVSKLAKENGAEWLVAEGRRGWLRVFDAVQCNDDYEVKI